MTLVIRRPESTSALPSHVSSAVSQEADRINERLVGALRSIRDERHRGVWFDVIKACEDASEDGPAGNAFLAESVASARHFLELLPNAFPEPEVDLDPDGEVRFDWLLSRQRMFSLSFGPRAVASYAGLMDGNTFYGQEEIGAEFPARFADYFRQLFEEAHR